MNDSILIALGVVGVLILLLVLKKLTGKKQKPVEQEVADRQRKTSPDVFPEETEKQVGKETEAETEEEQADAFEETSEPVVMEEPVEEFLLEDTLLDELVRDFEQREVESDAFESGRRKEDVVESPAEQILDGQSVDGLQDGEDNEEDETILVVAEAAADGEGKLIIEEPVGKSCISLQEYGKRLNIYEERLRGELEEATQKDDGTVTRHLQHELVVVNEKLALLAESHAKEEEIYQNVLTVLQEMGSEAEASEIQNACQELKQGNPDAAEALLVKVATHSTDRFKGICAYYSGKLAECRIDLPLALERYEHAIAIEVDNAEYYATAAVVARQLYQYGKAMAWMESSVERQQKNPAISPVDIAIGKRDLAYTYVLSGRSQMAGPLYKAAMITFTQHLGQEHPEMAMSWYQIGELQETVGKYDKALSLYRKALSILEKYYDTEHPALTNVLSRLAALCMELELTKECVPLYERLVAIREKTLRPTHPMLAMSLNSLAESYRLQGMHDKAEACYQKCLTLAEKTQGPDHPRVGAVLQELAKTCMAQRKSEEADAYQKRANAIFAKAVEEQEKHSTDELLSLDL